MEKVIVGAWKAAAEVARRVATASFILDGNLVQLYVVSTGCDGGMGGDSGIMRSLSSRSFCRSVQRGVTKIHPSLKYHNLLDNFIF
jgi:hypothetical protein